MRMELKYKVRRGILYLFVLGIVISSGAKIIGQAIDKNLDYNVNLVNEFNEQYEINFNSRE